jgi:Zn-dependent M28 family amino/carboxypeptidase
LKIFIYWAVSCFAYFSYLGCVNSVDNLAPFIEKSPLLVHLSYLSSDELAGRKFASSGNKNAQKYIIEQLKRSKVSPLNKSYQHEFIVKNAFNHKVASNIVAVIPGTEFKQKFIVLSAHLDHIGKRGRKIFNGADDNASGTSALLAIAQQLSINPLKHSVILLFTDAEEVNLTGAKAFVADHKEIINRVKLNINLDMLAGSKKTTKLRYMSRGLNNLLDMNSLNQLQALRNSFDIPIKKGFKVRSFRGGRHIKWLMSSDHGVFHQAGVPFLYFGVGTHINYHQVSDTFDNVNQTFFYLASNAIYQQLIFIDENMNAT